MPSSRLTVLANPALILPHLLLVAYLQHFKSMKSIRVSSEDVTAINHDGVIVSFDTQEQDLVPVQLINSNHLIT